MADSDISNSSKVTSKRLLRGNSKKARLILVAILAIGLVGTTLGYAYQRKRSNAKQSNKGGGKIVAYPKLPPEDKATTSKSEYDKTIVSVDKLITARDYDGAIKLLLQYEPKTSDPSQRYAITSRLGTVYAYKQDYKSAISWLDKAQQTAQPGADSLSLNIAIAAEKLDDKSRAISEYHKVIELLKAHPNPTSESNVALYEAKIKALGG